MKPPSWDGARPFIDKANSVLGFLEDKLRTSKVDFEINATVFLIDHIDAIGKYDAGAGADLMKILDASIARMRNPDLRLDSEKRSQRIRETVPSDASQQQSP